MTEPIGDRDSWLLTSFYPTGTARGRRRTGCIAMLVITFVALLATLLAVIVAGGDAEEADPLCEDLAIQLTYLDAAAADQTARDDVLRQMEDAGCE